MQTLDVDAEFEALTAQMFLIPEVDPGALPDWLTDEEMLPEEMPAKEPYVPRHSTGRERNPWLDVEVPPMTGEHPAVEAAATTAMLDLPVEFIKSPTAKHAHDGTALAMIDHAAAEIKAALACRSVPRGRLRSLLNQLEAMR